MSTIILILSQRNFFVEEDGTNLIEDYMLVEENSHSVRLYNSRNSSRASVDSCATTDSVAAYMSHDGVTLSLCDFCALIDSSQSLNTAQIVSVECWRTQTSVLRIPHRFLIFRLRRRNRSDVWIRVDRRPASRTKLFPRGRAETKDTVSRTVRNSTCYRSIGIRLRYGFLRSRRD